MKSKSLEIPAEFADSKKINPHQKLILSALSEEPQMYAGNIARRIGTTTQEVKNDLNSLINENYVISDNQDRPSYARVKGLGFIGSQPDKEFMNNFSKKSYNNNININNNYNLAKAKLFTNSSDDAYLAMEYWRSHGGRKHQPGKKIYQNGIDALKKLFDGEAFNNIPDELIHSPKRNKRLKFTLEDWKTSIDRMNIAAVDRSLLPMNKGKFKEFVKTLNLVDFIYNPFLKKSRRRSMFLQYLEPFKRIKTAVPKYKSLSEVFGIMYNKADLPKIESEDLIIEASNMYGDLIFSHEEAIICRQYKESKAQVIEVFLEFLQNHVYRFQPHHLVSKWLYQRLEQHLDNIGLLME